jgi:hypothetical protein
VVLEVPVEVLQDKVYAGVFVYDVMQPAHGTYGVRMDLHQQLASEAVIGT